MDLADGYAKYLTAKFSKIYVKKAKIGTRIKQMAMPDADETDWLSQRLMVRIFY